MPCVCPWKARFEEHPMLQAEPARITRPKGGFRLVPPWRDAVVCLSFANLCFLRVWKEILTYRQIDVYFSSVAPSRSDYLAAMLNVLLLGAAMFAVVTLSRKFFSLAAFCKARYGSLY